MYNRHFISGTYTSILTQGDMQMGDRETGRKMGDRETGNMEAEDSLSTIGRQGDGRRMTERRRIFEMY